jgi:Protein of unknown function (DUF4240)
MLSRRPESAQSAVCSPGINTVSISPESSQRWSNSNKTRASSEVRVTATSVTLRGYRPAGRTPAIAAISAITSVGPWCKDRASDTDDFWELIETARASAVAGGAFHEVLAELLAARTEQEILEYQDKFDQARQALYRWDVWAAAYLIGGGCSDDSFIDFRAGLIAQGRGWYRKAADSLTTWPNIPPWPLLPVDRGTTRSSTRSSTTPLLARSSG